VSCSILRLLAHVSSKHDGKSEPTSVLEES
jgi:hypothetical protein